MYQQNQRLFDSGGEVIKRDLLAQFSRHSNERKNKNYEIDGHSIIMTESDMLKNQFNKVVQENKQLKEQVNKQLEQIEYCSDVDCTQSQIRLLEDIIQQKDESITQYERQIMSFKSIIIQKNELIKELKEQIQFAKTIDFTKPKIEKISKEIQTEKLNYLEIALISEDQYYQEVQEYKKILYEYEQESKQLKDRLQELQSCKIYKDQENQIDNDDFTKKLQQELFDAKKELEITETLRKNIQIIQKDNIMYQKQYQETIDSYYFLQSEQRSKDKQIKELSEEIDRLKTELQQRYEPSVSSTETVTSPREAPKQIAKQKKQIKINNLLNNNQKLNLVNPQNVDGLIRLEDENQKLNGKITELRQQMLEHQKSFKQLQDSNQQKEQLLVQQDQKLIQLNQQLQNLNQQYEQTKQNLNLRNEKESQLQQEINNLNQQVINLQSDYQGLKIINQQLHNKIDKMQRQQLQQ